MKQIELTNGNLLIKGDFYENYKYNYSSFRA